MAIVQSSNEDATARVSQNETEVILQNVLRPTTLQDFVGQSQLKQNLEVILQAAKLREESPAHVLFYGPPGLGKTTLATIIAKETDANIKICSGPAIDKAGDLAAILTSIEAGDVIFIDEIHRLKKPIEEVLYTALEDFVLDLVVGSGAGARTMRLPLPPFTLVAATTKLGNLSGPLRDRFGEVMKLELYDPADLQTIVTASAHKLEIAIDAAAAELIARCGRGTPRVVNRLLQRVRDFAHVAGDDHISLACAEHALRQLGVDQLGLNEADRELLKILANKFNGGPIGLGTLAAALDEERDTLENICEPFLLRLGFLDRTAQGRVLLPPAYEHLDLPARSGGLF